MPEPTSFINVALYYDASPEEKTATLKHLRDLLSEPYHSGKLRKVQSIEPDGEWFVDEVSEEVEKHG